MEVIYCSSQKTLPWQTHTHRHDFAFVSLFLLPLLTSHPLWHLNYRCYLSTSAVGWLSLALCLSLSRSVSLPAPPFLPASSAVAWRGAEERRVEETGDFACSKYSLYVCGVLSSEERRDRGWFPFFCESACACVRVCVYTTVCLCDRVRINPSKHQRCSLIHLSVFPLPLVPPPSVTPSNPPLTSICLRCLFVFLSSYPAFCLPVCFGASHLSCMCLAECDSIEKSPKR